MRTHEASLFTSVGESLAELEGFLCGHKYDCLLISYEKHCDVFLLKLKTI